MNIVIKGELCNFSMGWRPRTSPAAMRCLASIFVSCFVPSDKTMVTGISAIGFVWTWFGDWLTGCRSYTTPDGPANITREAAGIPAIGNLPTGPIFRFYDVQAKFFIHTPLHAFSFLVTTSVSVINLSNKFCFPFVDCIFSFRFQFTSPPCNFMTVKQK